MIYRIAFLLLTLTLLGACREDAAEVPARPVQVFELATTTIEVRDLPEVYPVPGAVVSAREARIASRSTGFIEQISVNEGDRVIGGQLLAVIDSTQVEAAVTSAEATLNAAKADLKDANGDVRRFRKLARTQAMARDQLLDAQVRQAQAQAALARAKAELQARTKERRYTRLTSPADALVRERLLDPGDLATPGTPLLHLDILGTLEFELFLPSHRMDLLKTGDSVDLSIEGVAQNITGLVEQVVQVADPVTRQCKVRITLPSDSGAMPGHFGHARLLLPGEPLRFVPMAALTRRAGIDGVFVIGEDGGIRFRSVRLGRSWPNGRELLAGPPTGSRVALNPPFHINEGDLLRPTPANEH
ncbi:MAG: efflux RND transporter periplasmic adaptor subunit [Pseudomonadota bacterium]